MSTLKVTVEQVVIAPHPNADRLELAQVGLYRAVVAKGAYRTGDYALYIPESAVLPDELIEEIGLTGKLAGKQKNRVKAVRLRGELSQGIVCRPRQVERLLDPNWNWVGPVKDGRDGKDLDFGPDLGIQKWVPPIPPEMAGKVRPADRLLRWLDMENIKRYPDLFQPGEPVVATEKVHGTCFLLTWVDRPGGPAVSVSSKGFGQQGLEIERDPANVYWRAAEHYRLEHFADRVSLVAGAPTVGLFGEVYGPQTRQDLHYGVDGRGAPGFVLFDIAVDYGNGVQVFLRPDEFHQVVAKANDELLAEGVLDQPVATVPVLYNGPYDAWELLRLAEGDSVLAPGSNVREGLVVRPAKEAISPITNDRKIGKLVGEGYLTRGGDATEYE